MPPSSSHSVAPPQRQRWLSVLAKAPSERLETLWQTLGVAPSYTLLRRPEIGLVMVQGRISGSGAPFAAGEMTVTRAAIRLDSGEVGIGYVGGRHPRQAELIATIDALGQRPEWQDAIEQQIVTPLEQEADARRTMRAAKAAATKVDFFTVAREGGA
ncbi:alpha-D-ribose 1-methylphosphonate 5-triphosphate synthase subunit PhnG [Enhydrobacter aerosaccus]|uniref:Alpha-D-ribose 1-methylphosphonate 5-triphosphate synthase subunit PhnG n=2 Tax=Enhydrobacter aerosaccus TaxID=225324 RepID=A0A1T4SG47_9HYPH|nr:phosphonate C-P lyase system protein PhnG [Enhydrobacter aerosaccus]SKA27167.1 alpha-D-ribose 1-methylphosphonate 5-triphosphate synthase subunit PhnG [Enhydrobacter aerosaccus]